MANSESASLFCLILVEHDIFVLPYSSLTAATVSLECILRMIRIIHLAYVDT